MTAQPHRVSDPDNLPPGTALCGGRLEIEACLGRGGVATVYRVRDRDGRRLALKLMVTRRAADGDQRERFDNEWRILRALRGFPCVIEVEHNGRHDDGRPFFTMELLESPTLADLIIDREVTIKRACRVIRDVADALDALHARGVIHRDIKPDNIVVEPDRIRLLDFGYAYTRGDETLPTLAGLTHVEHRPGTPLYMAPEQADGEEPAPSFDIYALAVTLYEALVGHAPNSEIAPVLMMAHKCRGGPEELSIEGRVFGLPRALVALVDEGLRRAPGQRVATAAEVRDRLDAILDVIKQDRPAGIQDRPVQARGEVEGHERTLPLLSAHRRPAPAPPRPEPLPSTERLPTGRDEPVHPTTQRDSGSSAAIATSNAIETVPSTAATAPEETVRAEPAGAVTPQERGNPAHAREGRPGSTVWIIAVLAVVVLVALLAVWCGAGGTVETRGSAPAPSMERSEASVAPSPTPEIGAAPRPDLARSPGLESSSGDTEPPSDAEPSSDAEPPSNVEPPSDAEQPVPPVEPTRSRSDSPKRSRTPRHRPGRPPKTMPPPCPDVATQAQQANRSKRWSHVLALTKSSRCWEDEGVRVWLRVQALSELRRYAECAAFASSRHSAEARRMARSCATQLDEERSK